MTVPALYTPNTLALMRANAPSGIRRLATMLGWDMQRVQRVARQHNIDLAGSASPSPEIEPVAKVLITVVDQMPPAAPRAASRPSGDITLDPPLRCVERNNLCAYLSDGQWRIFLVLHKSVTGLKGREIADRTNLAESGIGVTAQAISKKLRPLGMFIDSTKGPGGGYRLVKIEVPE
jgi:hypothetical protein